MTVKNMQSQRQQKQTQRQSYSLKLPSNHNLHDQVRIWV